ATAPGHCHRCRPYLPASPADSLQQRGAPYLSGPAALIIWLAAPLGKRHKCGLNHNAGPFAAPAPVAAVLRLMTRLQVYLTAHELRPAKRPRPPENADDSASL